jgi:hypothetical protein
MTHARLLPPLLVTFGAFALVACPPGRSGGGDDDDSGPSSSLTCDDGACGGDPTGSWTPGDDCSGEPASTPFDEDCPDATWDTTGASSGLVYTFEAGGNLNYGVAGGTGQIESVVPTSCFERLDVGSCADLADAFFSFYDDFECNEAGDVCECSATVEVTSSKVVGTWSVEGETLTLGLPDAKTASWEFCVDGDRMLLEDNDGGDPYIYEAVN